MAAQERGGTPPRGAGFSGTRAVPVQYRAQLPAGAAHSGVHMKNIFARAACLNNGGVAQRKLRNLALTAVGIFTLASYFPGASGWAATSRAAQDAQAASVDATTIQFDSGGLNIDAYLVKPKG